MSSKEQQRIVALQRSLKVAKDALFRIKFGQSDPEGIASQAWEHIETLELQSKPTPLSGLVGR